MSIGNIVSVSGGKDSTALLLLAIERETENLEAVFADTGHEHPETYTYLDYLQGRLGITIRRLRADFRMRIARKREFIVANWPKDGISDEHVREALDVLVPTGIPMLDLCLWKGRWPSARARFCTHELKLEPVKDHALIPARRQHDLVLSWQGVRRDESRARARLPDFDTNHDVPGVWNYRPIVRWTAEDAFAMHRRHGIDWNPLYEQGMGRVGCMPCIHTGKNELREIARRFPDEIDRVARWEHLVAKASKRRAGSFFDSERVTAQNGAAVVPDTNQGIAESASIARAVEWSRTSRGGQQYDLIAVVEAGEAPVCASVYGLCE